MALEVVSVLGHLPQQPVAQGFDGGRANRWSWYLLLLSYPWHLVGGAIAIAVTGFAGGDFTDGVDVPGYVYPVLYLWMLAPLIASAVVGILGWVRGHRPAAIVPAGLSMVMIIVITVLGSEQFFGI